MILHRSPSNPFLTSIIKIYHAGHESNHDRGENLYFFQLVIEIGIEDVISQGGISSWNKKEGESFAPGDVLLEIVSPHEILNRIGGIDF